MVTLNLDIIILTNFIFTFMAVWLVNRLWGRDTKTWRILSAAMVSSIYLLLILFQVITGPLFSIMGHLLVSLIMALIAWGHVSSINLFKFIVSLYGVTFFFGGVGIGFWNIVLEQKKHVPLPVILFFVLLLAIILGYKTYGILIKWYGNKGYYSLKITLNGKSKIIESFFDTGHRLKGLASEDVIVVSWSILLPLLEGIEEGIILNKPEDLLNLATPYWQERIRLTPYRAIGIEAGTLVSILPERVELILPDQNKDLRYCLLALYNGPLHGRCHALLPYSLKEFIC